MSVADRLDHSLSAIVMNDAKGAYATEEVWDDTDVAQIDTIADTQLHRNVDVPILAADKEGESFTPSMAPHHASTTPGRFYLHSLKGT